MSYGMAECILFGIIISVIINIVVMKTSNLIELMRRRNDNPNGSTSHASPHRVPRRVPAHGSPRSLPTQRVNGGSSQNIVRSSASRIRTAPPPIPTRRTDMSRRDRDSYPRCPICRSSNRPGKAQKIFWDSNNNRWRCVEGHSFNS